MYVSCFGVTCILLLHACAAFKTFQERIPNGDRVPNPCKPKYIWQGVGHQNPLGGGKRNQFGKDFGANGQVFIIEFCKSLCLLAM